jgi:L-arabinose isomerase
MYAMDFPTDSILMSHMGEGNWRLAREDRPVRLIKRPLGIGGLEDPPTFLFQYRPGPATLATLLSLGGTDFRLVVAEGEVLDTEELPQLEMPYGNFRPARGVRECMNAWLRAGGPHHQVLNPGHRAADWEVFCELTGIELAVV